MAKIDHKIIHVSNPAKAPNGKFPFMKDGTTIIADSHFIYRHICDKYDVDLDKALTPKQKATALAFTRLAEDHLYWVMVYSRWVDEDFKGVVDVFFKDIPWGIRQFIIKVSKKRAKNNAYAHGISRHEKSKIYQLGKDDVAAIAEQLGSNQYFLGDTPSSVDAIIYAIIASNYYPDLNTPLKQNITQYDNLLKYLKTVETKFDYSHNH